MVRYMHTLAWEDIRIPIVTQYVVSLMPAVIKKIQFGAMPFERLFASTSDLLLDRKKTTGHLTSFFLGSNKRSGVSLWLISDIFIQKVFKHKSKL